MSTQGITSSHPAHPPESSPGHPALRRMPTGVPGLDTLLDGGLLRGGLYLVEGVPGSGKTILGCQIAFHQASLGDHVLFITVVAETHGKLMQHLSLFDFYDAAQVAQNLIMLSAFNELTGAGLDGLLRFVAESMQAHRPQLIVIDGFAAVREFSDSSRDLANFIHRLNTLAAAVDNTVLILSPLSGTGPRPEHTLVDGLIELQRTSRGLRRAREIEVHKMRGGRHLTGRHIFTIEDDGVRVYPRLETSIRLHQPHAQQYARLGTGIRSLDAILGGGLTKGSATSLMGPPGVGKTLLGLNFLAAGASLGEKGFYLGFYEAPERLVAKAGAVGLPLQAHIDSGALHMEWVAPLEIFIDEIAERVLTRVSEHGVSRVFIDGIEGFASGAMHPERVPAFITALTVLLRQSGVTTMLSEELPLFSALVDSKALSVSALVENVVLLRFYELDAELHRLLTILKLRDSTFDPSIREFFITGDGIEIADKIVGMEQILQGNPRVSEKNISRSRPAKSADNDETGS